LNLLLFRSTIPPSLLFFFFTDTTPSAIYTLSLHDALPISTPAWMSLSAKLDALPRKRTMRRVLARGARRTTTFAAGSDEVQRRTDRKSTRLNSSHVSISYAVFCLKKKKKKKPNSTTIHIKI